MKIFFGKELPATATLLYFKRVKFRIVFFHNAFYGSFYLVQCNLFFHKTKSIINKLCNVQGSQRLITCKNERFNMWYEVRDFHEYKCADVKICKYADGNHLHICTFAYLILSLQRSCTTYNFCK